MKEHISRIIVAIAAVFITITASAQSWQVSDVAPPNAVDAPDISPTIAAKSAGKRFNEVFRKWHFTGKNKFEVLPDGTTLHWVALEGGKTGITIWIVIGRTPKMVGSPYENSTGFAKYAENLREQALTKVEPQTFVPVYGADKKPLNVVDYFLLLPRDSFEGPAAAWLMFMKQPKCGLIDVRNGYMSCTGDGAQASFEVALFRFRDGSPLLAVCWGDHSEEEGVEHPRVGLVFLDFFRLGADKQMHKISRSIFPVADAGNRKGNWRFELPRYGRTVLVRSQQSGTILHELPWNGAKFQDEK